MRAARYLLWLLLLHAGLCAGAPAPPSGAEIASLCARTDADSRTRCERFFREGLARNRLSLQACPPQRFDARSAAQLFVYESFTYPEVLHIPARRLLDGMLIKFCPCPGRMSRRGEPDARPAAEQIGRPG